MYYENNYCTLPIEGDQKKNTLFLHFGTHLLSLQKISFMNDLLAKLRKQGHTELCTRIEAMDRFYNSDPLTYCEKVRPILALFLKAIEDIVEFDNSYTDNINDRINNLCYHRNRLMDDKLCNELQILRTLGNNYAHQDTKKVSPEHDKQTIKTAIFHISELLLRLPSEYKKWQKEEELKEEKKRKKRKHCAWWGATATLLAIIGILIGRRK